MGPLGYHIFRSTCKRFFIGVFSRIFCLFRPICFASCSLWIVNNIFELECVANIWRHWRKYSKQCPELMRSPIFKVYSPPPSALGADGPLAARMFPKPAPDAENKNAIRVPDKQCIVRYIIWKWIRYLIYCIYVTYKVYFNLSNEPQLFRLLSLFAGCNSA